MAAVTFGSGAISGIATSGTSLTAASVVIASTDTRLLLGVGSNTSTPLPTGIVRNSVSAIPIANWTDSHGGGAIFNASWWYIDNPTVGTFSAVATLAASTTGSGIIAIPIAGADLTRAPVAGTGNDAINTAASCSAPSGGVNDLQVALVHARSTTMVSAGVPQNVVVAAPTMPRLSINGLDSFSADFVTPGNPGNFAWTITSGIWVALGVTIFAPTSGGFSGITRPQTQALTMPLTSGIDP